MQADGRRIRRWVKTQLDARGRGAKASLARHLGIRPEAISRIIGSNGEGRDITAAEAALMEEFFGEPVPASGRVRGPAHRAKRQPAPVPLISWVSAGKLAESAELPQPDAMIEVPGLPAGDYLALRVRGDSMDRVSPDGSIIVVDRRESTLQRGKAYVFAVRGEATYKLWEPDPPRLEPYSTNPANRPIFIDRKRDLVVIGRVRRTFMDL